MRLILIFLIALTSAPSFAKSQKSSKSPLLRLGISGGAVSLFGDDSGQSFSGMVGINPYASVGLRYYHLNFKDKGLKTDSIQSTFRLHTAGEAQFFYELGFLNNQHAQKTTDRAGDTSTVHSETSGISYGVGISILSLEPFTISTGVTSGYQLEKRDKSREFTYLEMGVLL